MTRALRKRYGRARKAAHVWQVGGEARTTSTIPAERPIYAPVYVTVEEVVHNRGKRSKDRFGDWTTYGAGDRIRVGYKGASYWVDAAILDPA